MNYKKIILILACVFAYKINFAQLNKNFTYSAYADIYLSTEFKKTPTNTKSDFIYNHKRLNELNCNLLLLKASYTDSTTRANIGLMVGNYAQYNLSAEPTWAQFIYEANVGFKISKKNNTWLTTGIMPSHIGAESAISRDCFTLTRSMVAENSPYFETGIKISNTSKNNKWTNALLLLNGWQQVFRNTDKPWPAVGMQFIYAPNKSTSINYNNYIGQVLQVHVYQMRFYNNLYLQTALNKKNNLIISTDLGLQKNNNKAYWIAPLVMMQHVINAKTNYALRAEYFSDAQGIILSNVNAMGANILGASVNVDYTINKFLQWRIEAKYYQSNKQIFNTTVKNNFSVTSNLTARF